MGRTKKYQYHPDDEDRDYILGNTYRGTVSRTIYTVNNHPRAVEVTFADGKTTTVHKRSFEVSESSIDFYPVGTSLSLRKVGYMEDRRTTKWVVMRPLKYDLYDPEGIKYMMEGKRQRGGATIKYNPTTPLAPKQSTTIATRLKAMMRRLTSNST